MELAQIFAGSFLVGLSGAMMPGPLLTVAVARTPTNGPQTGAIVTIGHGIVEIFTVVALSLGLALIIKGSPMVIRVVATLGGVALILMAATMIPGIIKGQKIGAVAANEHDAQTKPKAPLIGLGALATISNPYWFVWWAPVGSALIVDSLRSGLIGPPVFFVGHILSDLVWYWLITIFVWQGRKILAGNIYRGFLAVCALFLIWLGGMFLYRGITDTIPTTLT